MGQVYWAAFEERRASRAPLTDERSERPRRSRRTGGRGLSWAGHGFAALPETRGAPRRAARGSRRAALPRASDIARIGAVDLAAGERLAAARGLPVYLRDDVVHRR